MTVIHTSQFSFLNLIGMPGFGTLYHSGNCDFWFNDALTQPSCAFSEILTKPRESIDLPSELKNLLSCSHERGMKYYIESVRKRCKFVGQRSFGCGMNMKGGCDQKFPGNSGLSNIPTTMKVSPDDTCRTDILSDYQVTTMTGIEPFCWSGY